MSEISKFIGQRIRNYRTQQKLSQEKLAELSGCHPTYIGQVERGEKNATLESIEKIASALNIPLAQLFEKLGDGENADSIPLTHYKTRYIGIVNELLATLMDAGDYTGVQHYATRAIELTPENIKAYYWLVCAMTQLDCSELAKNEIVHAKKSLTSEEFASLKKLMLADGWYEVHDFL